MTLKELLKSQEARLKAEAKARDLLERLWETAVNELMETIKTWIAESDPEGLLKLHEGISTLHNHEIDQKPLPDLDIFMGKNHVSIRPIAQNVLGPRLKPTAEGEWSGRVDMIGHPYSFQLWLLITKTGEHSWYIRNDRDYSMRPLTKESFEKAMVELLS